MSNILGLIPARGGSKGIPRKNIAPLAGRPLLAYTCEAALGSKLITRVVLSTDDAEIAQVGRDCGVEAPFLRPASWLVMTRQAWRLRNMPCAGWLNTKHGRRTC